ncbi:MAG: phosphate transport system regulatory protein PhoU [Planctomycetota bacterium]|nr:MAG: phosphate transport system regulatory protein PhoU [Planctomycetota bacterium]
MTRHLNRDLEHLERQILELGAFVEEALNKATLALIDRRPELAQEVIDGDQAIDEKEVEVEEECLKILALHQPLATDLRFIVAALKVNNDLERMGDLACNVAERALYLSTHEPLGVPLDFDRMVAATRSMVSDSLRALVNQDASLARNVCERDDEVDAINKQMFVVLQEKMIEDPAAIKRAVHTLSASRHLERIADLATNIAEDVVFMVSGDVIRHRYEDYREGAGN